MSSVMLCALFTMMQMSAWALWPRSWIQHLLLVGKQFGHWRESVYVLFFQMFPMVLICRVSKTYWILTSESQFVDSKTVVKLLHFACWTNTWTLHCVKHSWGQGGWVPQTLHLQLETHCHVPYHLVVLEPELHLATCLREGYSGILVCIL